VGVSVWLSALDVQYRDARYAIPFLVQVWLFASPVVYPASILPAQYQWLFGVNPMAGLIETFRWAILGLPLPSASLLGSSAAVALIILVSGLFYFRRVEHTFADVI
jgi:lipopolysaccharide transport system permease protein